MELNIKRQTEINYIRNLILDKETSILNSFTIADGVVYNEYKDIIDMIKIVRNYVNTHNPDDPDNIDDNTEKLFSLKSRIMRKNITNIHESVQPFYDKFDIEMYATLLRDILATHELEKIQELNSICANVTNSFKDMIESKQLTTGTFNILQYRSTVEQMMFILNSFSTIIPEGYPNKKVKELIKRINERIKNAIAFQVFALTPDGKVLSTADKHSVSNSQLTSLNFSDIFHPDTILRVFKPLSQGMTNNYARVIEITGNFYDDMVKYGLLCPKQQKKIPVFDTSSHKNTMKHIKEQAEKFEKTRVELFKEADTLTKDISYIHLLKVIGNPYLFEEYLKVINKAPKEDIDKLISSCYITFIFDKLPQNWKVGQYTDKLSKEKQQDFFKKKKELIEEALKKVKQEEQAVMFGGTHEESTLEENIEDEMMNDRYITEVGPVSSDPIKDTNMFIKILSEYPILRNYLVQFIKENGLVEQCANTGTTFKAMYIPNVEYDRIEYDPTNLTNKVVIGCTVYTCIKILMLLPSEVFKKYGQFMRSLFSYACIVFNQAIHFIKNPDNEYLVNKEKAMELFNTQHIPIITSILKCRQDDKNKVYNYRYQLSNDNKVVYLKYRNMNLTNDEIIEILDNVSLSATPLKISSAEYEKIEREHYFNMLKRLDSNTLTIDEKENIMKFINYMKSKETYIFGPYDHIFNTNYTENKQLIAELQPDFFNYLNANKSLCYFSFGQSGSGKTTTLIYSHINDSSEPGIVFLLLNNYTSANLQVIQNVSFSFYNICKGDQDKDKLDSYLLSNIANWDTSGDFFEVTNEPEVGPFIFNNGDYVYNDKSKPLTLSQAVNNYIQNEAIRPVSTTINNPVSSRSHAIIDIKLNKSDGTVIHIFICDLAGVENEFKCTDSSTLRKLIIRYKEYIEDPNVGHKQKQLNKMFQNAPSCIKYFNEKYSSSSLSTIDFPTSSIFPRSFNIDVLDKKLQYDLTNGSDICNSSAGKLPSQKIKFQTSLNTSIDGNKTIQQKAEENIKDVSRVIYEAKKGVRIRKIILIPPGKDPNSKVEELDTEGLYIQDGYTSNFITSNNTTDLIDKINRKLEKYKEFNYKATTCDSSNTTLLCYIDYLNTKTNVIHRFDIEGNHKSPCSVLIPTNKKIVSTIMFDDSELKTIENAFNKHFAYLYKTEYTTEPPDTINTHRLQKIQISGGIGLWIFRAQHESPEVVDIVTKNSTNKEDDIHAKKFNIIFSETNSGGGNMDHNVEILIKRDNSVFTKTTKKGQYNEDIDVGSTGTTYRYYKFDDVENDYTKNKLSIHYFLLMYLKPKAGVELVQYSYVDKNATTQRKNMFFTEETINNIINNDPKLQDILNKPAIESIGETLSILNPSDKKRIYNLYHAFLTQIFEKHSDYINDDTNNHKQDYDIVVNMFKLKKYNELLSNPQKYSDVFLEGFQWIVTLFKNENNNLDIFIMYLNEYCILIMNVYKVFETHKNDIHDPVDVLNPVTLQHVSHNVKMYSTSKENIAKYNCLYSKYEGIAINKALYEVNNDLKFISKNISGGEYSDLLVSTSFTEFCDQLTHSISSPLDPSDSNSTQYGIIMRVLASCLLGKSPSSTKSAASEYMSDLFISPSDITSAIQERLKMYTFTIINYSLKVGKAGVSNNDPPLIPFIRTTTIRKSMFLFYKWYKLYEYSKISNASSMSYNSEIKEYFKCIIHDIKKIFELHAYKNFFENGELDITSKYKAVNDYDKYDSSDPNYNEYVAAYIYIKHRKLEHIVKTIHDIEQMKSYVDMINSDIITPAENIMTISLIGTMVTTQGFINASSEIICSCIDNDL
jgi:hypothetical protein